VSALGRLKILITRRTVWLDLNSGEVDHVHHESWSWAWSIAGIHSYDWRWVRRYGRLACGCTRNPLTRRMVLYAWECREHGAESMGIAP
jgi:hypothetical protein